MKFEEVFKKAFASMLEIWGHEMSENVMVTYRKILERNLSAESLAKACTWLMENWTPTSAKKFPTPQEFLKSGGVVSDSDRAKKAIEAVKLSVSRVGSYNSVTFGDSALHRAIRACAGGWVEICGWSESDWKFHAKKFEEMYLAQRRSGGENLDHLGGILEKDDMGLPEIKFQPVLEGEEPPKQLELNKKLLPEPKKNMGTIGDFLAMREKGIKQ